MTTAIVVARGGSVRLPNKALLPFGKSTLIGHKVAELRKCGRVDRVVVGSDSEEILEAAKQAGAHTFRRGSYYCDESRCSANDMIANMAGHVEGDLILWAHPTNPLIRPETYDDAIAEYEGALEFGFDSLVSVTRVQRHAWLSGSPANFDPYGAVHPTASQLQPYFFQDGAIFIQPRKQMALNRYFFGKTPKLYEIPANESVDVDTKADLELATALWKCTRSS